MRLRHPTWKLNLVAAMVLLGLISWATGAERSVADGLSISNEFIRIRVNKGPREAGRFAVDTTGGDPSRSADNNQVLIYGSREPWTSYTTVLVDGKPVIFGGPTKRRAGKHIPAGSGIQAPQMSGGVIACVFRMGDIEVKQELGLARSPTTRVKDAVRIGYQITNRGSRRHLVGLRVVLDTMLGTNDGAPLRAGDKAITTATRLTARELPDYWQAFDSLANPAVISQGTLRADGLTAPDGLKMVDWGTLADAPWDFPFRAGADFTRRGEQEQDTAVALYWDPKPLEPGETRSYATLYGVGGVSLSPAQLSLGLTAPAEVDYRYQDTRPFAIVAYVENSGGFESRETTCTLELSRGLKLAQGQVKVDLGLLKAGETKQVSWKVLPTGEVTGPLEIAAAVASENLEPNRVVREIIVNSPPQISLTLLAPEKLSVSADNRYFPSLFEVRAEAVNLGAQAGQSLVVILNTPEGLELAEGPPAAQVSERVDPGESRQFSWILRATGMPTGQLTLTARATAAGARPAEAKRVVDVPWLTPEFRVYPGEQTVPATTDGGPTLVPISVKLAPAQDFLGATISVNYDPAVLDPLYVSRGDAFVHAGRLLSPWSAGRNNPGMILEVGGERGDAPAINSPEITLFTIVFLVKGPGQTAVSLEPTRLLDSNRREVDHGAVGGRVTVQAMQEGG